MPPKGQGPIAIASKNHNNTNNHQNTKGLLPVNTAAPQQTANPPSKNTTRLKLEVRRLPPALTKHEFLDAFGEEWKPMAGKVDWFEYRPGKTKPVPKLSEQSRAYIHLLNESHIKPFETKFLEITFQDQKGSYKDTNLKHLQPVLGFAPNQRIPATKQRLDGRQGTIDQDAEFIAFLEGETQPATKPQSLDAATAEKSHEKVSSTPLLDDLREKKANKAKAASTKPNKSSRGDAKDDKPADKNAAKKSDATPAVPTKTTKGGAKSTQAVKEAVKIATKQAVKTSQSNTPSPALTAKAQQQPVASPVPAPAPAPARKQRERVTPSAIKTMLQRDLGLAPAGKRASKAAAAAAAANSTSDAASTTSQTTPATPAPTSAPATPKPEVAPKPAKQQRNRKGNAAEKGNAPEKPNAQPAAQGPVKPVQPTPTGILKKAPATQPNPKSAKAKVASQNNAQKAPSPSPSQSPAPSKPAKSTPQSSTGAIKAYLKHANASQGITEPLIVAALSTFGDIVKVDIDKRKGTALAEFKTHEGLKAAMSKRSIPVAQGAVEVLEFRERPGQGGDKVTPAASRGGGSVRGKGRAGKGTANPAANSTTSAGSAPAAAAAAPKPADAT